MSDARTSKSASRSSDAQQLQAPPPPSSSAVGEDGFRPGSRFRQLADQEEDAATPSLFKLSWLSGMAKIMGWMPRLRLRAFCSSWDGLQETGSQGDWQASGGRGMKPQASGGRGKKPQASGGRGKKPQASGGRGMINIINTL
ncbi:Conserved oligomeric Golgi complex subunit 1 [Liparis tanakae]|uniref:Conserved oligomeric Golgi complex subunit 1 n=1 Tax=Liparis tanakae TaxID=230148 RepID=A0A4Z2EDT1_9TELE|nr:Conserved oligomeric Golgi complex subunit 1 [Liparis tanakae]